MKSHIVFPPNVAGKGKTQTAFTQLGRGTGKMNGLTFGRPEPLVIYLSQHITTKDFINQHFLQKLSCQKPLWDEARLSSLVNKWFAVMGDLKGVPAVHFNFPLLSFSLYITFKTVIVAVVEPIPLEYIGFGIWSNVPSGLITRDQTACNSWSPGCVLQWLSNYVL